MHALLGRNHKGELLTRKTFAAGEHREVAMDTARFYAVTGKRLQGCPEILRTVAIADVQWFIQEAGPNYLARHKANGQHKSNSGGGDQSGSGFAFRFLRDRHLQGMSEAAAMDALLNDLLRPVNGRVVPTNGSTSAHGTTAIHFQNRKLVRR